MAPVFDGRKAVLFDDRWASAREDLVKLWLMDEDEIDANWPRALGAVRGRRPRRRHAGHLVAGQGSGRGPQRARLAVRPRRGRRGEPGQGSLQRRNRRGDRRVEGLDRRFGGRRDCSTAVRPSSRPRPSSTTTGWRSTATCTATTPASARTLWVVPANMASYSDIDALVEWVGNEQTESLGPQSIHLKDAQTPTLLFPFAAPRVAGDLSEAGSRVRDGDEGAAVGRAAADRRPVDTSAPSATSRRGCTWCCPVRRTAACSAATAPTANPSPRSTRW